MAENPAALPARPHAVRRVAKVLEVDPDGVPSVEVANAGRAEVIQFSSTGFAGWTVSALTPADQAKFRSSRSVGSAMVGWFLRHSLLELPLPAFVAPVVECEIAFVLGADPPPRRIVRGLGRGRGAVHVVRRGRARRQRAGVTTNESAPRVEGRSQ